MRIRVTFLASTGLALLLAFAFAFLAVKSGFLFGGVDTIFTPLVATAICAIALPLTALVCKRKGKHFGWRALFIETVVLALLGVTSLSWLQTRQHLTIFMQPEPVPKGIQVKHGRSIMFSSYVHFTGSPEVIASLIKAKQLVEVPAESPETSHIDGFTSRERTKEPWDWWQPATMSNPKFFFRHHTSQAIQGWSEGWWVSGQTNEVYAFISG